MWQLWSLTPVRGLQVVLAWDVLPRCSEGGPWEGSIGSKEAGFSTFYYQEKCKISEIWSRSSVVFLALIIQIFDVLLHWGVFKKCSPKGWDLSCALLYLVGTSSCDIYDKKVWLYRLKQYYEMWREMENFTFHLFHHQIMKWPWLSPYLKHSVFSCLLLCVKWTYSK